MALPAADTFTGTNGDPLSGNWTGDTGSFIIGSNKAVGNVGSGTSIARWTADAFPDDQYAEGNIDAGGASVTGGITVRAVSTGGGQGYSLFFYNDGSGPVAYLYKFSGGGSSLSYIAGYGPVTSGDLGHLEIAGSAFTVAVNGATVGTPTDGTYTTGSAGLFAVDIGSVDNFGAGAVGGGGGGAAVSMLTLLGVG